MLKNSGVRKVIKPFSNITEEEQWLQNMLKRGWMLKKYHLEDSEICQYIFEPATNDTPRNLHFKIDCRQFHRKRDYKKYIAVLKKAGWIPLAQNSHFSKHIFYSEPFSACDEIFSRLNRIKKWANKNGSFSHIPTLVTLVLSLIFILIYTLFENPAFRACHLSIFNTF